jgi:hypothetical protein
VKTRIASVLVSKEHATARLQIRGAIKNGEGLAALPIFAAEQKILPEEVRT